MLQKQHAFRRAPGLDVDGRDMGTTVFLDAILKIFVTASTEVRAERRYKQLKEKGFDANLRRLLDEIRERDARDAARTASLLKPAADACILDTSLLSIFDVVDRIHGLLQGTPDPLTGRADGKPGSGWSPAFAVLSYPTKTAAARRAARPELLKPTRFHD